jgi:hypothetical protein
VALRITGHGTASQLFIGELQDTSIVDILTIINN